MELAVLLGDVDVGRIRTLPDGRTSFALLEEYRRAVPRPVLGQYFEDHLDEVMRSQTRLPAFFSNLLPEGGLRELIARRAGVHAECEAHLIAHLGDDLPGAVVVRAIGLDDGEEASLPSTMSEPPTDGPLRFSLAGAQLKFSVMYRRSGRGPTLPLDGRGGDWIAKLPSETYEHVPENEFAMVEWARRAGLTVPETALVDVGEVAGLPIELEPGRKIFLSRRFDRPSPGIRIHQEDFAQVANVRASERYRTLSYDAIARIVLATAGDADFEEVLRRLAFNVLIGNGDAHLKNWSLQYPDAVHARLSPAYDLVSTVVYIPTDGLALKLAKEREFASIGLTHFRRIAERAGTDPDRAVQVVRELTGAAMNAWPEVARELPLGPGQRHRLDEHLGRLRLLAEAS
ncbi:MAG TPA: type II toxin-antitoxin system HipA family toxin [Kofleriaceae bacterium]|jgi:serine/threonine-protein kinase HipA|nr:type II toxin-antitoxin system HipA family toxin [Kofleriaceae bacterium]